MVKNKLQVLIEGAIISALAMALSYIPHSTGISSIEILYGIVPIYIYTWRRGLVAGMGSGLVWGLLDLILRGLSSGSVLNVWQGILEYPLAFSVLGLAGWATPLIQKKARQHLSWGLMMASGATALIAKYFLHFIAGVLVWGSFAPKSMNPWLYSFIVNGGSALASLIFLGIVLFLLRPVLGRLIKG
ncbi:energy-coupled thiamine transporter ThiT [Lactobacillus sp. DCY120]|uniref:Energy-coupled thiamine transporter ThiT n=2 Tax=Bombilactobacillus apium TaxID=2675299 RepID=A0A850R3E4_9LACO|nr:energy-coupled thiamine transporter ThiT [Bombilactobacillus apium]NVY96491.1 energy-coupled thiamine transporter ThiT [Bombilactobacillus apium]